MNKAAVGRGDSWTLRDPAQFSALVVERCAGREAGPFTADDFAVVAGVGRSHIQKVLAGGTCSRSVARAIIDRLGASWLRVDDWFTTSARMSTEASREVPQASPGGPGDVALAASESISASGQSRTA